MREVDAKVSGEVEMDGTLSLEILVYDEVLDETLLMLAILDPDQAIDMARKILERHEQRQQVERELVGL